MELIIEKAVDSLGVVCYTVSTVTARGVARPRYSVNNNGDYNSLDCTSKGVNTYGATNIDTLEDTLAMLRCYAMLGKDRASLTKNNRNLEKWVNAYPQTFERFLDNYDYMSWSKVLTALPQKLDKNIIDIIDSRTNSSASTIRKGIIKYINGKNIPHYLELIAVIESYDLERYIKIPSFYNYIYKTYCRLGIMEQSGETITKRAWKDVIYRIYAVINKMIDTAGMNGNEISDFMEEKLDQKWDMLRYLSNFEAISSSIISEASSRIIQSKNEFFWNAHKNLGKFSIKPLASVNEYEQAGKKWHNCLGSWGLDQALNKSAQHIVAEITPENGETFVAGIYYKTDGSFQRFSYVVYDHNKTIERKIQDELMKMLMGE